LRNSKRKAKKTYLKEVEKRRLLDSDIYLSYLKGDDLSQHAENVVAAIQKDEIEAYVSSILFDDIVTALRSKQVEYEEIKKVIIAIASIGGTPLTITPTIALTAVSMYEQHGGSRKLHYFDAYHAATAHHSELPLVTSDKYLIEHQKELGIQTLDLRKL